MSDSNIKPQTVRIDSSTNSLTKALKKLVENSSNLIFSDGKITSSEWNATLDALVRINNNRKQNNQVSIFSGGTDKTNAGWQNSFIVYQGQEINFTADEMSQIYEAMGVSVNATAPVEKEAATEVSNKSATPVEENSAPKASKHPTIPPELIAPLETLPEQKTQAELNPKILPSNLPYPKKANTIEVEGVGPSEKAIIYDENGYIDRICTQSYVIRSFRGDNGIPYSYTKYTFVSGQDVLSMSDDMFDMLSKADMTERYNADLSPTGFSEQKSDGNGNLFTIYRDSDGSIKDIIELTCDEDGNPINIYRNSDGIVESYELNFYNESFRDMYTYYLNSDGSVKGYSWRKDDLSECDILEYHNYNPNGDEITDEEFDTIIDSRG